MAQSEVIREFLVSLGYEVNEGQRRRFVDGVESAGKTVLALGAAATAAALTVKAAVVSMSSNLEDLYWASERTKASAANIRAFGFAAGQMGSTVDAARGSLESFASFLRSSPGAGGLVRSLGVATEQAGRLRDTADVLGDLGTRFRAMPYFQARAYAGAMGIDERTLQALINGMGQFSARYQGMLRSMRVDLPSATRNAHLLMNEVRETGAVFSILGTKIVSGVSRQIADDIGRLRNWLISNSDLIATAIERVIAIVLAVGRAVAQLVQRAAEMFRSLLDWFGSLDPRSRDLAKAFGLLAAAMWGLNAAFAASPIGRILILGTALLALWDDYKTWKEGGESLIDWAKWEPGITAALEALRTIGGVLDSCAQAIGGWQNAFTLLLAFVAGRWVLGMLAAIGRVTAAMGVAGLATGAGAIGGAARFLGLGAAGGFALGMIPGQTQTREHEASQPGGATLQQGNRNIAERQKGLGEQALRYFMANGYTREQAAGLVAQLEKESAFDVNAFNSAGGGEGAMGILQWRGSRIRDFRRLYGRDPRGAPFEQQLEFMLWELNNTEAPASRAIRNTRTAADAGRVASRMFVRPGENEAEKAKYAEERAKAAAHWAGPAPSQLTAPQQQFFDNLGNVSLERVQGLLNPPAPAVSGAGGVTINQETNITVQGGDSPRATGAAIAGEQGRVNADLLRNTRGAVQ